MTTCCECRRPTDPANRPEGWRCAHCRRKAREAQEAAARATAAAPATFLPLSTAASQAAVSTLH
jgi:hypothetical protein